MVKDLQDELARLGSRVRELGDRLGELESAEYSVEKERIAWRILTDFVPYALEDAEKGEEERARRILAELSSVHSELVRSIEEAGGGSSPPPVPRYITSPVEVRGGHFVALRREADRELGSGPVLFTGYGHFDQVKADIPKFADYGMNIIQIEIGPSSTVKGEHEIDTSRVQQIASVLDRAADHNVAVDLLLSPHYFPGWALERYPHLSRCEGGFIHFCVDAPEARDVVGRHIRTVISGLRGKPALTSVCLSNEPIFTTCRKDTHTMRLWADHLRTRFGKDIQKASRLLRFEAGSFEEFPVPEWRDVQSTPIFYEWCIFNHARFSDWHRWMADIVHEAAPQLPVHAKIMPTFLWRKNVAQGVDPRLFCRLSQINGNDCWCMYNHGEGEYAQDWLWQNVYYDMLRSFEAHPVFNSENHIIKDRERGEIPWQHIRSSLWQGAIHGQCATTMWVWERTYDAESDFAGSIMHRPLCVRAAGEVSLDLMRFADEVVALQNAAPGISILYSIPSMVYDPLYIIELRSVYEASNFLGHKIAFVDVRELEADGTPCLLVPSAVHLEEEALPRIRNYVEGGGRLILIGEGCLTRNQHDLPLEIGVAPTRTIGGGLEPRSLRDSLEAVVEPVPVRPLDPDGTLAWGMEWLAVRLGDRELVNGVNLLNEPQAPSWTGEGGPLTLRNLFTSREFEGEVTMRPMEPLLAEIIRH
jgi:hypothetical protein